MSVPASDLKDKNDSWVRGLDSIRFVLAFMVFFYHLGNPFHEAVKGSSHLALKVFAMVWGVMFNGVGAVMAFFIISGFVIHYPYRNKYPDTRSFLARRWLRIGIPLLVISPLAGIFHKFSLIPIWSLYCELIYYTIYPVLIRIKLSWFHKFLISFVLSFVLIVFFARDDWASLIHRRDIHYSGAYWQLGDFMTWMIGLPCWLLGVILAERIDSYKRNISSMRIWVFRLLAIAGGSLLGVLKFHFFVSYIISMNFLSILLFFWIRDEILYYKDHRPAPILEFSGKFSYSLYLCHTVIISFIRSILPFNVFTYIPIIVFTVLFSYLFYLAVERPGHLLSRWVAKSIRRDYLLHYK